MADAQATGNKVVVLCGSQGCCPEVEFDASGEVEIRDDHGGKVRLTKPQWEALQKVDPNAVVAS